MTRNVLLRDICEDDLPIFFEQQRDPSANYMAAFTSRDPNDRAAFDAHWTKLLQNDTSNNKTVLFKGAVAGNVSIYELFGEWEVCYWIGKEYWGRGIATQALAALLEQVAIRPLHARAAKDNVASVRVLEKCGFQITGEDKGFAKARGEEIEEWIFLLEI